MFIKIIQKTKFTIQYHYIQYQTIFISFILIISIFFTDKLCDVLRDYNKIAIIFKNIPYEHKANNNEI